MVTYEVTATVDAAIAAAYERYMRTRHIPDLLATGCFVGASLSRSHEGRYRIRYEAADQPTLDRYLVEHAAALRAHVDEVFSGRVALTREVWTVLERWP